jgi:hypothetical protein
MNGICGCGSPACCCQPAIAGGFIYADLWGELSTHLASQALFTQSSPVCEPLLQAFPFLTKLGEVTLHLLSQACLFIYSSRGKCVFPPLLWSFPPTTAFSSFSAPDCWACAAVPASRHVCLQLMWEVGLSLSPVEFSSLRHSHKLSHSWLLGACLCSCRSLSSPPGLFIYSSGKDSPPPLFRDQGAPPSLPRVFIVLIAYYSVSLFSTGGGWSVQGAMLIWPRVVCGSTVYRLAHLVHVFPSRLSTGDWWPGGPPDFSI